jgi:hypothetical protein
VTDYRTQKKYKTIKQVEGKDKHKRKINKNTVPIHLNKLKNRWKDRTNPLLYSELHNPRERCLIRQYLSNIKCA